MFTPTVVVRGCEPWPVHPNKSENPENMAIDANYPSGTVEDENDITLKKVP
jgi:hypothetical protein